MGNNQSSSSNFQDGYNMNDWTSQSKIGNMRVLSNRRNPQYQIQEYGVSISNQNEFSKGEELYNLRKNDRELVNTKYSNIRKRDQMCSKSYAGEVYTERIPVRLSNITHIPFPDVLHVYNQAFNGYERLMRKVGPFKVDEECIGVNSQHVVKVWHSPNFEEVYPHHQSKSEQAMIRNIVSIIEGNTDETSMPPQEPNFTQYLFRQSNNIGFGEAKRKLEQYANQFNRGVIPNYLNCIAKVGGAQNIRGKYLGTSNHNNNQLNQTYYGSGVAPSLTQSNVYQSNTNQRQNYSNGVHYNTAVHNSYPNNNYSHERYGNNTAYTFGRSQSQYIGNNYHNQIQKNTPLVSSSPPVQYNRVYRQQSSHYEPPRVFAQQPQVARSVPQNDSIKNRALSKSVAVENMNSSFKPVSVPAQITTHNFNQPRHIESYKNQSPYQQKLIYNQSTNANRYTTPSGWLGDPRPSNYSSPSLNQAQFSNIQPRTIQNQSNKIVEVQNQTRQQNVVTVAQGRISPIKYQPLQVNQNIPQGNIQTQFKPQPQSQSQSQPQPIQMKPQQQQKQQVQSPQIQQVQPKPQSQQTQQKIVQNTQTNSIQFQGQQNKINRQQQKPAQIKNPPAPTNISQQNNFTTFPAPQKNAQIVTVQKSPSPKPLPSQLDKNGMQILGNTYNNVTNLSFTAENRSLNGSAQQIAQVQERSANVTTSQQKIQAQNQNQNRNFNANQIVQTQFNMNRAAGFEQGKNQQQQQQQQIGQNRNFNANQIVQTQFNMNNRGFQQQRTEPQSQPLQATQNRNFNNQIVQTQFNMNRITNNFSEQQPEQKNTQAQSTQAMMQNKIGRSNTQEVTQIQSTNPILSFGNKDQQILKKTAQNYSEGIWNQSNTNYAGGSSKFSYQRTNDLNLQSDISPSGIDSSSIGINKNTKLSEVNQSISSIGLGQPKTVTDKMFSDIQENSIHNSTRNFYQNLGTNYQYSTEYPSGYELPKASSYNKKYQSGQTSSDIFQKLKKNEQIPVPIYEDHNYFKVNQNKYSADFGNSQPNSYSFGNQLESLSKNTGSKKKLDYKEDAYLYNDSVNSQSNYRFNSGSNSGNIQGYSSDLKSGAEVISTSNYFYQSSNYNAGGDYAPTYEYTEQKQYKEYSGDNMVYGYKDTQHVDNINGYSKKHEEYGSNEHKNSYDYDDNGQYGDTGKKFRSTQIQSRNYATEEEDYAVQWDPDILADLEANVHNK